MSHYNHLLGSPHFQQPGRSYYQILGISPEERDPQVIEEAALHCSSEVRVYQVAREMECALELNEIARALNTLLDPAQRQAYDLRLATPRVPEEAGTQTPSIPIPLTWQRERESSRPSGGHSRSVGGENAKSCDVTLVYQRQAI